MARIRFARPAFSRLAASLATAGFLTAALFPLALSSASTPALAAGEAPQAAQPLESRRIWLTPEVTLMPRSIKDPIIIAFSPDEARCKKAYGDAWAARCSASLGQPGEPALGVKLTPAVEGAWRWNSPDSILFDPEKPWPAGKTFRASFAELPVPSRAALLSSGLDVVTPPLTLEGADASFWLDPAVSGERLAAFEFWFTTAPDRAAFERTLSLDFDRQSGLRLDRPVFIWSADGASVFVKTKVLSLPKTDVTIRAKLPGVAAKTTLEKGRYVVAKGLETASSTLTIPGAQTLMRVKSASAAAAKDEALESVCLLKIDTTLAVKAEALASALEVYALPAKLNAGQSTDTDWRAAPVIDDEVLSRAKKLSVALEKDSTGPSPQSSFALRVKAEPGSFLFLRLPKGFGPQAYGLPQAWSTVLKAPTPRAEIRFLQPGNVLSLAGTKSLSLFSSGVEAIHWRVARVRDDFLAIAANRWRVLSDNAGMLPDNLMEAGEGLLAVGGESEPGKAQFVRLPMDYAPGLYEVTLEGRAKDKNGTLRTVASQSKRILMTDTALIVKENAAGAVSVFAGSLTTGEPRAGAQATLLAQNGTVLEETRTDALGRAAFKSTAGLTRERRPAAVVVRAPLAGKDADGNPKEDLSWLSLTDAANLSSTGAAEGTGRAAAGDALTALAFSERGVYRAGETIHFGAIVKRADFAPIEASIPLLLRVSDDAGRVRKRETAVLDPSGVLAFDYETDADEAPGRLRLDVMVADGSAVLATAAANIEDFAPETLTLAAALDPAAKGSENGWLKPEDAELSVKLTSLFGGGAAGRRIKGEITATPLASLTLPGWRGYRFESPAAAMGRFAGTTQSRELDAVRTDADGKARLTLPLSSLPIEGWASVSVFLEGFEVEGGRAATAETQFLAGRSDAIIGWKLEESPQPMTGLIANEPASLSLVALGRDGKPLAGRELTASIAQRRYAATLSADVEGRPVYSDRLNAQTVRTTALTTDENGRAALPLMTDEAGDWLVTVADADGTVLAAAPYRTIDTRGAAQGRRAPTLDPTLPSAQVRLSLSGSRVESGEPLTASILSPFKGFGLLTLEADDIVSSQWLRVEPGDNAVTVDVPKGAAGKYYAHLSLVRDQSEADRYLEGYAEAIAPVIINEKAHRLALSIEAPETVENARGIPVAVKSDVPSRVFVWAVDDGILSLTNYRTPDPMKSLFEDRALQVDTRQVLDKLMPDAAAAGAPLPPFGGDFESARAKSAAAGTNPFKRTAQAAAVWWAGVVETGPEGAELLMNLPESFNGRVRIMAAGADAERAGKAEASLIRQAPLVLEPMLPRAVAPGDRFRMGATASPKPDLTGREGVLEIVPPAAFGADGVKRPLAFADAGAAAASADFTAPDVPMTADVRFSASVPGADAASSLAAERTVSLSVRPAAPWQRTLWSGMVKDLPTAKTENNGERLVELDAKLYPYEAKTSLTLSREPISLAVNLAQSMRASPWASVTETMAAALPLALAVRSPELTEALLSAQGAPLEESERASAREALFDEAAAREARVIAALEKSARPAGVANLPWLSPTLFDTAQAVDYLLAIGRGIEGDDAAGAPVELVRQLAAALRGQAARDPLTLDEARSTAYALWVLAREGTMVASRMKPLIATLDERFPQWRTDTTLIFLAGAASAMRMTDDADELLAQASRRPITTAQAKYPWTPEIAAATAAAVFDDPKLADAPQARYFKALALEDLAAAMTGGPVSPAYALAASRAAMRSPERAAAGADAAPKIDLVCASRTPGFDAKGDKLVASAGAVTLFAPGCSQFAVKGRADEVSGWFWLAAAEGYPSEVPPEPFRSGLSVERRYLDAAGKPQTSFRTGDLVTVEISIRAFESAADARVLTDIDVLDLLPGGFELADPPGQGPDGATQFSRSEDRMRFAASVPAGSSRTYRYRVRAVTPGDFAAGPVWAGSLSRPSIRARGTPSRISIDAPSPLH